MKHMTTIGFVVASLMVITAFTGCENSGQLTAILNTWDDAGNATTVELPQISEVDAPDGAIITFTGGLGFKEAEATIYLENVPEPVVQEVVRATDNGDDDKCLNCGGGAVTLAATAVNMAATAIAVIRETSGEFDIAVPGGDNLVTTIIKVVGNDGSFVVITFRGRAYYDDSNDGETGDGYNLSTMVSPAGAGTIAVNPDQEHYTSGQEVSLTATANSGYEFSYWTVNSERSNWTEAEASVIMDSDVQVIAVFTSQSNSADTTPPVITLNGSVTVNLTVGSNWTDPGATAIDVVDGVVNVTSSGSVNTSIKNSYTINYSASDNSGNVATATRTVIVGSGETIANLYINLTLNSSSSLYMDISGAIPNSAIGLEIYYVDVSSGPFVDRETLTANSNGDASGGSIYFRPDAKILRFSVVNNTTSGGYVPYNEVAAYYDGSIIPLVDDSGNLALQVTAR